MVKRINEFECNKTWFRVEGVYPIKVVMRLQNEMAEHFCDKQNDHIIETLLVAEGLGFHFHMIFNTVGGPIKLRVLFSEFWQNIT